MIDVHFRWLLRQNLVMFTWYISFSDYSIVYVYFGCWQGRIGSFLVGSKSTSSWLLRWLITRLYQIFSQPLWDSIWSFLPRAMWVQTMKVPKLIRRLEWIKTPAISLESRNWQNSNKVLRSYHHERREYIILNQLQFLCKWYNLVPSSIIFIGLMAELDQSDVCWRSDNRQI